LWPVLLLLLRFSTIFKDAASKTGQNQVTTKKKSRPGGPRTDAGPPPIQPGRSGVKIRLDSEVISVVDTVAKRRKLDRSRVIEGALRQWLKEDKTAPGV
jgi:hypothetical protein